MESLSLTQVFGEGAFQDGNILVIQKYSLLRLTPSSNNTDKSLLLAILITALEAFQGSLTDPQGGKIIDPQGITINYNNSTLYELLSIEPWRNFSLRRNGLLYVATTLIINQYSEYADTEFS